LRHVRGIGAYQAAGAITCRFLSDRAGNKGEPDGSGAQGRLLSGIDEEDVPLMVDGELFLLPFSLNTKQKPISLRENSLRPSGHDGTIGRSVARTPSRARSRRPVCVDVLDRLQELLNLAFQQMRVCLRSAENNLPVLTSRGRIDGEGLPFRKQGGQTASRDATMC